MKVCKFGGSSLADAARINEVCDAVAADPERRIVVVSAPGKRHDNDTKVTDLLICAGESRLAGSAAESELEAVVERYAGIQKHFELSEGLIDNIRGDLGERLQAPMEDEGSFIDAIKAGGEDNCAKLVAEVLRAKGIDAVYKSPREAGLLLSDEYGSARILPESRGNISRLRNEESVVVFPGFFGHTRDGRVATFPRGGSDITGGIVAAAVGADIYENFTDVDSVYAADPGIVPGARPIELLTYREMRELSYSGFGVLHDEAIAPLVDAEIPIAIKNTRRPNVGGTLVVPEREHVPGEVVGIASGGIFCTIAMSKYLMNREIGFGRRLLQIFEEEELSFEHMPSGIDTVSIILREDDLTPDREKHVMSRIRKELSVDSLEIEHGLALVMIVGEGMRYSVGLSAKATSAMANAGVNIEMLNQGSSEISMMFGVKKDDRDSAVRALYGAFFAGQV